MEKDAFLIELKDILEIEENNFNEDSVIHLTSLATLSIMAFVYDNYEIQIKPSELQKVSQVKDLMRLIGNDYFA